MGNFAYVVAIVFFLEGCKEWQSSAQPLTFIRVISAMLFPQTLVVKDLLIMMSAYTQIQSQISIYLIKQGKHYLLVEII